MKKYVLGILSLLVVALTPITAFATPNQGEFLIQPGDGEAYNGEDVYATVRNDAYVDGGVTYNLKEYKVIEKQFTASPLGDPGTTTEIRLVERPTAVSNPEAGSGLAAGTKLVKISYLPAYADKTITFEIVAVFEHPTSPTTTHEVESDEFLVTWSAKKMLVDITDPAPRTGVPHGTAKTAEALGLPEEVEITLDDHTTTDVDVAWNVASSLYVVTNLAEQTFPVTGTVILPDGIDYDGYPQSLTTTITVTVNSAPAVAAPTADPVAGTYDKAKEVTLFCSTAGASIYYTLDGTNPTTTSTKYTSPFPLAVDPAGENIKTYTVKAIGVKDGMNNSEVFTAVYMITPPPKYTITVTNDGHGTASADVSEAKANTPVHLIAKPSKNYKFKQWVSTGTPVTISSDNDFIMPAGNVAVKAEFAELPIYEVDFYTQHGPEVESQLVYEGEKVTKPTVSKVSGYTFGGFYTDKSFTSEFNFNKAIKADTDIYLKWTKNETFTVTFVMNGHGNAISPVKVEKGKKVSKPSDPSASGYNFEGWYKEASCSNKYDFDSTVDKNFSLYAKWTSTSGNTYNNNTNYANNGSYYNRGYGYSTPLANMYTGNALALSAIPGMYAQSTQPFVYQQVLPEGSVMCTLGGNSPIIDMKAYGTDPKNIINQQILAKSFMETLYNMDAACYKTVDLYPTVSVKGGPNDGSLQMLRWTGTNYPAGAVFGLVWTYWDKAYIIPGMCDMNGTVTLSNFRLRPESTITLVIPMERVSTEVATSASSAQPNGVTQVKTTTTTTTTETGSAPVSSTPASSSPVSATPVTSSSSTTTTTTSSSGGSSGVKATAVTTQ